MSELNTPFHVNQLWNNDDGVDMATVNDANHIWAFDCYEYDADEILKCINGFEKLQRENDALRASMARLEEAAQVTVLRNPYCDQLAKVLKETPQQSLAEIEAAAVEKFKQHIISQMNEGLSGDEGCDLIVPIYEFELFKSQLRQQGGG